MIHFHIMSQYVPRSYKFSRSFTFSPQNSVCISFSPPHPSYQCTPFQTHSNMLSKKSNSNSSVLKGCEFLHMESAIIVVPAVTDVVQR